nr:hypothetical protein [Deltaproteobacteria bacterium]
MRGRREDLLDAGEPELLGHRAAPAFRELRRAEHGEAIDLAAGHELGGDEQGLDGLADAHVVGDEQAHRVEPQRHEERDELVGARLDADAREGAKRPRAGAEPDADGVAEQRAGAVVAEVARGVGQREGVRRD